MCKTLHSQKHGIDMQILVYVILQVFAYDPEGRVSVSLMKLDYQPSGFDVYFSSASPSAASYALLADQDSLSESEVTNPARYSQL